MSNSLQRREKEKKNLRKTAIFTQNLFSRKLILVFGANLKQMTVGT